MKRTGGGGGGGGGTNGKDDNIRSDLSINCQNFITMETFEQNSYDHNTETLPIVSDLL